MIRRLIIIAIAALALSCASNRPDRADPPDSNEHTRYSGSEIGPSPVGSIPDVRLRDDDRNKDVVLTIDYPTRGGPHPLILLSPGFGGSHRGYVGLSSYWAANDYVVIRVNHGDRTANVQSAEDIWANATPSDWRNRVRDLTFVIDSLQTLTERFPELGGKIDSTKIGVAGHSYGAHTAMLLGGVRTFPGAVSYADARVKAVIAMSPHGPSDARGLTMESWTELRVPTLFMTGSADQGVTEAETPEWRAEAFRLAPAGDKWLVSVLGAGHVTFAGGIAGIEQIARETASSRGGHVPPEVDPNRPPGLPPTGADITREGPRGLRSSRTEASTLRQRDLFAIIRGVALTFFDAHVRGETAGREALEKTSERPNVTVERK